MIADRIGGFVLAGGQSSRMGTDKALMGFAGVPLVARAVATLRAACGNAQILSRNAALAAYGPLVEDIHAGCGPVGGMEAALAHSPYEWNLFLPVDMPLLPVVLLRNWVGRFRKDSNMARIQLFTAGGRPQPGCCVLHKDVLPFLTEAIERGEYKLMRAFEWAAEELAVRAGVSQEVVLWRPAIEGDEICAGMSAAQLAGRPSWFANVNTPEEFAVAERWFAESGD